MKIEITQQQHTFLVETLNSWGDLCRHEAAAFASLGPAGLEQASKRLGQYQQANDLIDHLAKY